MSSAPNGTSRWSSSAFRRSVPSPGTATKQSRFRARRLTASNQIACPPPSKPVITVSATQEASDAATAASAAVPPSSRISIPASTVAGWPAASPGRSIAATLVAGRDLGRARASFAARGGRGAVLPGGFVDPHQGSEAGDHLQARAQRVRYGLGAGSDRAPHDAHQPAHGASARAPEGPLLTARAAQARRPSAPIPELPAAKRPGGLSGTDQGARSKAIEDRRVEV